MFFFHSLLELSRHIPIKTWLDCESFHLHEQMLLRGNFNIFLSVQLTFNKTLLKKECYFRKDSRFGINIVVCHIVLEKQCNRYIYFLS